MVPLGLGGHGHWVGWYAYRGTMWDGQLPVRGAGWWCYLTRDAYTVHSKRGRIVCLMRLLPRKSTIGN